MRLAVNGFGRMGKLFTRAALDAGLDVVAVHEPKGSTEALALSLLFDSVQGRWPGPAEAHGDELRCAMPTGERRIRRLRPRGDDPDDFSTLPWREHGIDLVVDCSGRAKQLERCQGHLDAGAGAVLVSNPVRGVPNLVYGVNHETVDWRDAPVFTAASCTTNCLAPIVRAVHDAIGIERGVVTTVHAPTNTQEVTDRPHKDPRRARSALLNLIPTSTNSATAVTEIVPELRGRLDSIAVRAPVLNASLVDCAFDVARDVTVDDVNACLREAAEGPMRGVLGFEQRPLVSSDYAGDPRSGIVDAGCTRVVDGRLVKVMAFYDNEWGYVNRMVDVVRARSAAR